MCWKTQPDFWKSFRMQANSLMSWKSQIPGSHTLTAESLRQPNLTGRFPECPVGAVLSLLRTLSLVNPKVCAGTPGKSYKMCLIEELGVDSCDTTFQVTLLLLIWGHSLSYRKPHKCLLGQVSKDLCLFKWGPICFESPGSLSKMLGLVY